MFSVNELNLIGTLGRDAETRFTTNDVSVTNFSIATEHSFKDKNGDYQNTTTWHNCVAFNLSQYFRDGLVKGNRVRLQGRVSNTTYNDKDGNKRYKSEVIVDSRSIILFGKREGGSSNKSLMDEASADESPSVNTNKSDNEYIDDLPF
jgi:single-strand DNA-binding protein